jgi:protoporphyrinogen oxidase
MAARWSRARLTGNHRPRRTENVADWATRVFGGPPTSHLIGPALQGIYAASSSELSAAVIVASRTKGGGRRRMMAAPERGMGLFIERLQDRLLAAGVRFTFGTRIDRLDSKLPTIVATDAAGAASLIEDTSPRLASMLRRVQLRPLSTITAFYPASPMDLHGFGVLFPRDAGIGALGVLFNADVFVNRSTVRSETWIHGAAVAGEGAVQTLADDRRRLTGRDDTPIDVRVTSLPQAVPLYSGAISDVEGAVGELPGHIQLAGNYLGRLGVAALLEQAAAAATRLRLAARPTRSSGGSTSA